MSHLRCISRANLRFKKFAIVLSARSLNCPLQHMKFIYVWWGMRQCTAFYNISNESIIQEAERAPLSIQLHKMLVTKGQCNATRAVLMQQWLSNS